MSGNPLVAAEFDSTTGYSGIGIVESAAGYVDGIQSGNWVEIGIGAAGVGLETLSIAMDPAGALLSYGIAWLIEHVDALSEALDWLAGNPDAISSHAQTWGNVANAVSGVAEDFTAAMSSDTTAWQGAAADAYRARAADVGNLLRAAATAAQGIGAAVELAGLIVAAVREIVRDLIADLVSRLIVYAAELAATLGVAAPWVAAQATSLIAKWAAKIADVISKLVRTISNLIPLLRNLDEIFSLVTNAMGALRRGTRHTDTTPPATTSFAETPPATTTPSAAPSSPAPSPTTPQAVATPSAAASSGTTTPEGVDPGMPGRPGEQSAISRALDGTADELVPGQHGGSSRPGDDGSLRSYERTLEWERNAYQAIRNSDDVDDLARHLADVSRIDGSQGFSTDEIRQIKEHVFFNEHPLEGPQGRTVMSRFDPSAEIAEAWLRLRSGRALDEDVVLLEHELAESRYWQDNPGATYREAHSAANDVARWETRIPAPTIEDYNNPWR